MVIDVSPIVPGTTLSEEYGIGPGMVMIRGENFGTDVILTGLLLETLGKIGGNGDY